jgi:hypothetical protein
MASLASYLAGAWSVEASPADPAAQSEPGDPEGPPEIRDEHVFAQVRLTLPATTALTVAGGRWTIRTAGLWSNSFSWSQTQAGEHPNDRRYLVDGETATADLTLTRGIGHGLDLSLRLPWRWRGGGHLDGLIEWWHSTFHLKTGSRDAFLRNAFRADGRTEQGNYFSWDGAVGTGLGNVEVAARRRLVAEPNGWAVALIGRLSLPSATGVFTPSTAGGLQLVATRRFARPFNLDLGVGGTVESTDEILGVNYEPVRGHAYAALAWRALPSVTLHLETDAATRLVSNVEHYPGTHWLVNATGALRLSRSLRMELGLTENILSQGCTTDVAFHLAVVGSGRGATRH